MRLSQCSKACSAVPLIIQSCFMNLKQNVTHTCSSLSLDILNYDTVLTCPYLCDNGQAKYYLVIASAQINTSASEAFGRPYNCIGS